MIEKVLQIFGFLCGNDGYQYKIYINLQERGKV